MNRELKFRALKDDISDYNFYYGSLIYDKHGNPRIYDIDTDSFHTCLKGTEGQFTGLTDKNGIYIYESDILKDDCKNIIVSFESGSFGYFSHDPDVLMSFCNCYTRYDNLEVIGNIHENPELT